jgi:outer membrane protein OmpA-like peptidoglycan-associated protein
MKKSVIVILLTLITTVAVAQQKQTIFDNSDFVVEHAKFINTVGSDISPLFVNDSIYFSAIREDYFNKNKRERKNKAFYDMYSASVGNDGILTSKRVLVPGFGNDFHEGPADYCEATGELFVTLSNVIYPDTLRKMFPEEKIRLRLVIMKKTEGKWQNVEEFPFNNDNCNLAHPAVSVTGDTLVFSGNLDSLNVANTDLYMSVRNNGKWSVPVNLGEAVNTPGKEMFPTFIDGGILAFSSNAREGGLGNLDIWYTDFPRFSYVKNAGNKINSKFDDFGLVIYKNGKTGYFASNCSGEGSDDIFCLNITARFTAFNGKVLNRITKTPIANSQVVLKDCNNSPVNTVFTDAGGNFSFQVLEGSCPEVEASKENFSNDKKDIAGITYAELVLAPAKKYEMLVLDVETKQPVDGAEISGSQGKLIASSLGIIGLGKTIQHGSKMVVKRDGYLDQSVILDTLKLAVVDTVWLYKKELNKTFVLENIYYDFDKWDILPESEIELNKLIKIMNDNPDIKVELGSHTDARGSDSYNEWLSQKRSDSAVGYIIKTGIPKGKIVAKGYGETQLVNECKNGVHCTDMEHRKNRRTEFKIIGF